MKISKEKADMIRQAIDGAVGVTGYPVAGQVLNALGVDRATIRDMGRKGLVKSVRLAINQPHTNHITPQIIRAYYTENVYPKALEAHLEPAK